MKYIKVPAIDSTNDELRRRLHRDQLTETICLSTDNQLKGRGQRGTQWNTEPSKNLTFSILAPNLNVKAKDNFKISMLVSIVLIKILNQKTSLKNLSIKWPNDILADHHKIAGILIENTLNKDFIKHSIIGIGINVNQTNFENLPQATSLRNLTQQSYNLDKLLKNISEGLINQFTAMLGLPIQKIIPLYKKNLYGCNQCSKFEFPNGEIQNGIIQGVALNGRLKVSFKSGESQSFDLKEIKLLY